MLYHLRSIYKKITNQNKSLIDRKSFKLVNRDVNRTSEIISEWIRDGRPFIVARFGSVELHWYLSYKLLSKNIFSRIRNYISHTINHWRREDRIIDHEYFRPRRCLENTRYYVDKMDQVIPEIDFLASWSEAETHPLINLKSCKHYSHLFDIEPYKASKPWTLSLENKKVLIIHPMVDLIQRQMQVKDNLFSNPVLPEFEIIPVKALFFDDPVYNSWSKIYEYYKEIIQKTNFDIAIIGCGTWGMPLCYEIKKLGKQAIHLGGATQILFGIMGKRWADWPEYSSMINDYWITKHETPPSVAQSIEGGCYW